jgi:hypothetical protein
MHSTSIQGIRRRGIPAITSQLNQFPSGSNHAPWAGRVAVCSNSPGGGIDKLVKRANPDCLGEDPFPTGFAIRPFCLKEKVHLTGQVYAIAFPFTMIFVRKVQQAEHRVDVGLPGLERSFPRLGLPSFLQRNCSAAVVLEGLENCGLSNVDKSQVAAMLQVCVPFPQRGLVEQLMMAPW